MKNLFDEILRIKEEDEVGMELMEGASDEDIAKFEQDNGITLPGYYKEFLRFSDGCFLFNGMLQLYGIKSKPAVEMNPKGFDDGYILIGSFDDGEGVCITGNSEKIFRYSETTTEHDNFVDFLDYTIRLGEEVYEC